MRVQLSISMAITRWKSLAFLIALGLFTAWLYYPGLKGGFFFDDQPNITVAANIQLDTPSVDSILSVLAGNRSGMFGRPVARATFVLNHVASGLDPFAFKTTNLIIHLLCACLIYALSLRVFRSCSNSSPEQVNWATTWLTIAWTLHPIQLLPILHVVQRMTSLSALFLLASLILHIDGRIKNCLPRLAVAWILLWPLSFYAKETGLLFPLFALAWELTLGSQSRSQNNRFTTVLAAIVLLAAISTVIYLATPYGRWIWTGYDFRDFSPSERLMTEARVIWHYLALIGIPQLDQYALFHDDIRLSTSLWSPSTTLPALLGILGLICCIPLTRKRFPLVSFGIAWFLIGHLLESTILPLEIAHEHRNYVPLFGALLLPAGLMARIPQSQKTAAFLVSGAVLLYLAFVTHLRADQFGDEVRRTQLESQFHPFSARAQFDAGRALAALPGATSASSPTFAFAKAHYERATEIDPTAKMPWLALIVLHCGAKQMPLMQWTETLSDLLAHSSFAPGDQTVIYAIKETAVGDALCLSANETRGLFSATLSNPRLSIQMRALTYSWQADYFWLREKDIDAAKASLSSALRLDPENTSDQLKWAQLLMIEGRTKDARDILRTLSKKRLRPDDRQLLEGLLDDKSLAGFD